MPPTRNAPTHLLAVIIVAGSCLSFFATFATASQPAKLRTAVEKGMSPAGEMAAKARAALKKFGCPPCNRMQLLLRLRPFPTKQDDCRGSDEKRDDPAHKS